MRSESTYLAARMVASNIEDYFYQHLKKAQERGEEFLAPLPGAAQIETMIDAAFWASLRREEGHAPKVSLAFLPPHQAGHPLLFEKRINLTAAVLTKLSPGVERPGVHLGVWYDEDELYIWGTTLRIPNFCFVLDVSEPGLLVVKYRRLHGFGKLANVAVLIGDQVKVVDESSSDDPDCPALLRSLLKGESLFNNDQLNVLTQLSVSMRAHKHGGTLLVVPSDDQEWRTSIIKPMKYAIIPPYSALAQLICQDVEMRKESSWQIEFKNEINSIAGLTAVDGATIINDRYEVLAFGTKIGLPDGNDLIEEVYTSEPVLSTSAKIVNPALNGGTRHLSAAQFIFEQKNAMALVASQDGHFTVFTWSENLKMVQAHRIDSLLM